VTGIQTGAITLRSRGALGAIIVHLKPEAACRVVGGSMEEFTDAIVGLCELFSATETARLQAMLQEAPDAAARAACVQEFLLAHIHQASPDVVVRDAVLQLCRNPVLPVRRLASNLDISERHLARRFHTMVGITPKHFARIARIGKAVAAKRRGAAWADIAYACGFNDQAH
jgi:AraC-like DNA-binding protein